MIDEPDAQASQERLTHVQIAQDASKPVSHDRLHEQAVAIYDLLDDNLFSVIDAKGPYHLHLKTDNRHIYFDVRDELAATMSGFVMALGLFVVSSVTIIRSARAIMMLSAHVRRLRFRRLIWAAGRSITKGQMCYKSG